MFIVSKLNIKMKGKPNNIRLQNLILPEQPHHDDFLQVMSKLLEYSAFFGIMGRGTFSKVWFILMLVLLVIIEVAAIWKVIKALAGWAIDIEGHRSVTARFSGTIFYTVSILSLILSSKLSMSWEGISEHWKRVERTMTIRLPSDDCLKKKMWIVIWFTIIFCSIEHLMSFISLIGLDCEFSLILKKYTLSSHGFLILRTEYNDWIPLPLITMKVIATFLWTFQDLLIVLISLGLTSRYRRLNKYVERISALETTEVKCDEKKMILKTYTWRKIREAYVKQANLVRDVDDRLGSMVVLSCFNNFYFICLQLFMSITQGKTISIVRRIYYGVSIAWLCIRTCGVVLAASDINVRSKAALKYMFHCDAQCYNVEIERFQNQLTKDYVALSGMGFFYLNRIILLQMFGAILTYELVLIQFDDGGSENNVNV